jgi:hypothetical protein
MSAKLIICVNFFGRTGLLLNFKTQLLIIDFQMALNLPFGYLSLSWLYHEKA